MENGFEADGVKYPPCSKGKAAATPATATATSSLLTRPSSSPSAAFGGVPTRPLLPMAREHGHGHSEQGHSQRGLGLPERAASQRA